MKGKLLCKVQTVQTPCNRNYTIVPLKQETTKVLNSNCGPPTITKSGKGVPGRDHHILVYFLFSLNKLLLGC